MSYAKEKDKVEGKIKYLKRILLFVVLLLLVGLCVFSLFFPVDEWKYYVHTPNVGKRKKNQMRIHFVDVGQGDATVIEFPDGDIMLIDGGNGSEKSEKALMRYLNALDVNTIDYLLVTHADSDHCGGLDSVLRYKKVEKAFIPNVVPTVNAEYASFYAALEKENCQTLFSSRAIVNVSEQETPYVCSFLWPTSIDAEETMDKYADGNRASTVVWLDYMGVSTLLTGDAPSEVEQTLMAESDLGAFAKRGVQLASTEILKVSHHGSNDATSGAFVDYLDGLKTAVISCGANNLYGHPSRRVCATLENAGAEVYRTDTQGSVIVTITGENAYTVKTVKK